MAYEALYRKYRPRNFDDVVGQKVVVQTLKNSVNSNKIAHAYLFSGPRGTGKTSIAKILASAINCESADNRPCMECPTCLSIKNSSNPDVIEMDAASNRGIDDIRSLIEKVKYLPLSSKYKVYIIDEVHMLTNDAFNALLKTLEEPPKHVIFILATTEPNKILPTIISRCQRYNFSRVDDIDLMQRLEYVLNCEQVAYEINAVRLIAQLADGGVRDALSILDQCIAYSPDLVSEAEINSIYGTTTMEFKLELINKVYEKDISYIVSTIRRLNDTGIDIRRLTEDLLNIYKEEFAYLTVNSDKVLSHLSLQQAKDLKDLYNIDKLMKIIEFLMESLDKYSRTKNVSDYFEVSLLKIMAVTNLIKVKKEVNNITLPQIKNKAKEKEKIIDFAKETVINSENDEEIIEEDDERSYEIPALNHQVKKDNNFKDSSKTKRFELIKYDDDFYLSLLAGANKESKSEALNQINKYHQGYIDFSKRKYSNIIMKNEIVAVSQDMILIVTEIEAIANQINDRSYNMDLYRYLKEEVLLDRMVYGIVKEDYDRVIKQFMKLFKNKQLPEKAKIARYQLEKNKEVVETVEDKLYKYFKEVEIKEN